MGNASTCCSHPIVQNKDTLIPFQKNMLVNEDCDVHEWEADDFVKIGLQSHPVKEHKLLISLLLLGEWRVSRHLNWVNDWMHFLRLKIKQSGLSQINCLHLQYHRIWREVKKIRLLNLTTISFIMENGRIAKNMGLENCCGQMAAIMKVDLLIMKHLGLEDQFILLEIITKEVGNTTKLMATVSTTDTEIKLPMKGTGLMINSKDKEKKHGKMDLLMKENIQMEKQGRGMFKWGNGNMYLGDFKNNKMDGHGVYYWKSGKVYDGEWKENRMDGEGSFNWPDGRKYKGGYKNDLKEGYGIFEWSDGRYYKGEWKQGKQHGKGVLRMDQSKEITAEWVNGKMLTDKQIEQQATGS